MASKANLGIIRIKQIKADRLTLEQIYIFFLSVWSMFSILTDGTMLSDLTIVYAVVSRLEQMIWISSAVFILVKISLQAETRDWHLLVLIGLGFLSLYISKGIWIVQILVFVCGAKNVNLRKAIKYVFICELIAFATIVLLSMTGLIENVTLLRAEGSIRYSLGFYHPNTLSSRIFQLTVMYFYLKDKKISFGDTVIIGATTFFVYQITNSLTAVLMLMLLFMFSFLTYFIYKKRKHSILANIAQFFMDKLKYVLVLMMFFATYVVINFKSFADFFSGNMASRISQSTIYFQTYGLSLFGTKLELNSGVNQWHLTSDLYTLDNGYMYLLIGYGVVFFVLFIAGEMLLFRRTAKQKDYILLTVLSLYAIYGFSETNLIRFSYNFSLLFLAQVLWRSNKSNYKVTNEIN